MNDHLTLEGTMSVRLARTLASADGKRSYPKGAVVQIAIQGGSSVRIWHDSNPPVLATFKELVGSELR